MSAKAQTFLVWWGLLSMLAFGLAYGFLLKMLPLPPATQTPAEIAAFYLHNSTAIRIGAIIASYVSAFAVPVAVVASIQMRRLEGPTPVWSTLQLCGGILMSMFLVFPPILWGAIAFDPARNAEITAALHQVADLTLVTTDQYYIFQMVPIAYIALSRRTDPLSAFPRWFGYFTIWAAIMFEAGGIAFLPKTGPFAWNGLFAFWIPFVVFGTWFTLLGTCLLSAISRQAKA